MFPKIRYRYFFSSVSFCLSFYLQNLNFEPNVTISAKLKYCNDVVLLLELYGLCW